MEYKAPERQGHGARFFAMAARVWHRSASIAVALVLLAALNAVAHFIPPEREGHEPDDYILIALAGTHSPTDLVLKAWRDPARPLTLGLGLTLARTFGFDPSPQILLLFLATTGIAFATLWAARQFLTPRDALLVAALYVVFPAKHEIYATMLYVPLDLAVMLFVLSLGAYSRYAAGGANGWLLVSAASYGIGMLGYELGFLLPLILFATPHHQSATRRSALFTFASILALVFAHRLLLDPGLGPLPIHRGISTRVLAWNAFTSLPTWLFGPHALRTAGYGLQGFFSLPATWMVVALVSCAFFFEAFRRALPHVRPVPRRMVVAAVGSAVALALPAAAILVESRHTSLALAPLSLVALEGLRRLALSSPSLGAGSATLLLFASQGLAMRQTEHGRITSAMRRAVIRAAPQLAGKGFLVFDLDSFARAIPHSWGRPGHDTFRAYWGMHAFAANQLRRVPEIAGVPPTSVKGVACATPLRYEAGEVVCDRQLNTKTSIRVPAASVIVDYALVCGARGARCP
jgi:hypothetical protein